MADRVVKVSLQAQVSNYLAGMEQARKKTQEAAKSSEDLSAKFAEQNAAMTTVGAGLTAIGALAAVGVGLAIAKFVQFDQAMSAVEAATHESAVNMERLRDAALDAGARTVFSATEAANAIEELGKAGLTTEDILSGGLDGALDLAAAGGLGVAEAAGIAATAIKTFNLEGKDMGHVSDLLAAGAGKAMGDVTDLSAALKQSGMVAASTGISIEETTGTLSAFAAQGLLGSDAGTSFKSMLQRLTPQSAEAASKMKELGISAYDAQGNFIGMERFAGNLQTSLAGLTTEQRNSALATIFGSDAVRAATVLYSEGERGIAGWNAKVNDAGYAADTAAMRLDNLAGDVEALGGAFDTALIKSGEAANVSLRFLVQAGTDLVDVFNDAHPAVQQTALVLGAVVAAAGLAGGAFLLGVPKVAEFSLALATLSTSQIPAVAAAAATGQRAIAGFGSGAAAAAKFMTGPWGIAMAAAAVGVAILAKALDDAQASASEITNSLQTATTAAQVLAVAGEGKEWKWLYGAKEQLADLPAVLQASAEQSTDLFARFDQTHFGAFDALRQVGESLAGMASSDLPAAQNAFRLLVKETDETEQSQWRLLNTMPGYLEALKLQANELDINVSSTDEAANKAALLGLAFGNAVPSALAAADAYLAASDEAAGLDSQMRTLIESINEANGVGQDAVTSNATFQASLASISSEVQKQRDEFERVNGTLDGFAFSLDESTMAGSANSAMLTGVAADAQAAAQAQYELDQKTMSGKDSTDKYVATLATSRQALIDQAVANGANAEEVQRLADKVFALPPQREVQILADTADAKRALDDFITTQSGRKIYVGVLANPLNEVNAKYSRASGGILPGAPSATDNIVIHAATGEFITRARQAAIPANRAALEFMNNGGVIQGYANGGSIGSGYLSGRDVRYVSSGPSGAAAPSAPMRVSLEGARFTFELDGREITGVMREQAAGVVSSALSGEASKKGAGYRL